MIWCLPNQCHQCWDSWESSSGAIDSACQSCGSHDVHLAGVPEQVPLQAPFRDNPFRILGLSSSATTQEIQAKYAEAQIKARFDRNGDTDAKLDQLRQAQAQLLDPTKRQWFQDLWFFDPDSSLQEGLTPTSAAFKGYLMQLDDRSTSDQQLHDGVNALLLAACHASEPDDIISFCSAALEAADELGRRDASL